MKCLKSNVFIGVFASWLVVLLGMPCPVAADEPGAKAAEEKSRVGIFETSFVDRSPHSDPERMSKVAHWSLQSMPAYDVIDHTFQMVVPDGYDGSEDYGLIVFIHPNNKVALDRFYGRALKEVLAKHKLIWVSYSDAGNPVMPNIRLGLALDAAHNVAKQYRIDAKRVYVSGLSGGGRMTCMAGVYYPGVFTGAVPIVGSLYFRAVKVPEDPALRALMPAERIPADGVWRQSLIEPKASVLRKMTSDQSWVFLAGETDYNMPQMRAHFEQGFEKDGFERAHYLEVPGMGHAYPDVAWYEKAIVLLDQEPAAAKEADLPPADEKTQRRAAHRLKVALNLLERDRDRGLRALNLLVEEFPNTEAGKTAKAKLAELAEDSEE